MRYLIILLFIAGCSSAKQSTKFFNKSYKANKAQNAIESRKAWPCIPSATKTDSSEYKKYLAAIDSINNTYDENPLIVTEYITDTMTCFDLTYYLTNLADKYKAAYLNEASRSAQLTARMKGFKPIHDTIPTTDSTLNFLLQEKYRKDSLNFVKQTEEVVKDNAKLHRKVSTKNTIIWVLIAFLLLIALAVFITFKTMLNKRLT